MVEANTNRIRGYLNTLRDNIYGAEYEAPAIYMKKIGYDERDIMLKEKTDDFSVFENGSRWGGKDVHACFMTSFCATKEMEGKEIWMQLRTGATDIWNTDNPQFLIYVNKKIVCGMDMNHHEVRIFDKAKEGDVVEIGVYAYSNSATYSDYFRLSFMEKHCEVEKLYYDVKVPFEAAMEARPDSLDHINILKVLNEVVNKTDLRVVGSQAFYESLEVADEWLVKEFYEKLDAKNPVTVHSIGHTHIDVAWKWPVRQTREKVLRSFATVLNYMDDYPAYRFMSSTPLLYQFVKEQEPEMFERIKARVSEGRWEPEGAMWLEADCNLTSGESLVRQILKGKQFFAEEFGVKENKVLWLPDVFGYSAALPQILKKSGIDYFMTTKINWNESNKMPHDVLMWKGIDGSEVLTYFITSTEHKLYPELIVKPRHETTYNGRQNVTQVMGTWQRFSDKELAEDVLTCYGYGDGGGGPTREMLEEDKRMALGIPGVPVTKQTFVREFFELMEEDLKGKKVPKWNGELYLEYHRGTYTSQAKNKKNNRLCEYKNEDAEWISTWAKVKDENFVYPKDALEKSWKTTLLNQFHDILPGSSIAEVYEVTDKEYAEVLSRDEDVINDALSSLKVGSEGSNMVLFNPCPFERDALVETESGPVLVEKIPSKGFLVCDVSSVNKDDPFEVVFAHKDTDDTDIEESVSKDAGAKEGIWGEADSKESFGNSLYLSIQTPFYQVSFNKAGEISELFDKRASRDVLKKGEVGNRLIAFEDRPWEYDCWNIDSYYEEKSFPINEVSEFTVKEETSERLTVHIEKKFMTSVICQDVSFYRTVARIDFKTYIDWNEQQILLKAAFPVDVVANKCTCDIQFGNVERPTHRNTSWDEARFEFAAQKWVDISEAGYGVSLLNDCKYGYDVNETTMRLTLLKSGIFPDENADKGHHEFTYSLFPHLGDFRTGKVIEEAYKLNRPVFGRRTDMPVKTSESLISCDRENVFADTVKPAEDGKGIIIRLHEEYGMRSTVLVDVSSLNVRTAIPCDLLERELEGEMVAFENGIITTGIKPYEILTFRLF